MRPASAYVLFANQLREEQKDSNLNFTQLARLVGDRWKNLDPADKEAIEAQAGEAKKRYNAEVSNYKKSHEYQLYQDYLVEFKERALRDEKPEKLEPPKKVTRLNLRDGPDIQRGFPYPIHRPAEPPSHLPGPVQRPYFSIPSVLHDPHEGKIARLPLPTPVGYANDYMSTHTPESYSRQTHLPYPLPVKPLHQQDSSHYRDCDSRLPSILHDLPKESGPPRFNDH